MAVCLAALVFGFVGSMPLAGPIAVMVLSRAAGRAFADARRIGFGAALAEGMYAAAAFWGFAALLGRHPVLVPISHAVSAVVLVMLGFRFVFFALREHRPPREKAGGTFLIGFSVSALNPTLLVTWSAAVAFLYSKGVRHASALYALPFGACAGVGVAAWFLVLVRVLRRYQGVLPRVALTMVVRALGVVLLGLGVWSGVQLVGWIRRPTSGVAACAGVPGAPARRPLDGPSASVSVFSLDRRA
ncbi:MAG TPA: LysE family transporter [Polyangiaceae bacterium]|nr:LysE family transporter [Polyangiaceae bacterium]